MVLTRAKSGLKPLVSGAMAGRSQGSEPGHVDPHLNNWLPRRGRIGNDGIGEEANLGKRRMGRQLAPITLKRKDDAAWQRMLSQYNSA